jgi:hypothetical protein
LKLNCFINLKMYSVKSKIGWQFYPIIIYIFINTFFSLAAGNLSLFLFAFENKIPFHYNKGFILISVIILLHILSFSVTNVRICTNINYFLKPNFFWIPFSIGYSVECNKPQKANHLKFCTIYNFLKK